MVIFVSKMPHIFLTISIFLSILIHRYRYLDRCPKKPLVYKIKLHGINTFIKISSNIFTGFNGCGEAR